VTWQSQLSSKINNKRGATMKIQSTRFGELDISVENILKFDQGIPGFPNENEFAFLPYEEGSPFAFLQSTNDADLTFLIVEPFSFLPEYTFELSDEWSKEIGVSTENPPQLWLTGRNARQSNSFLKE